MLKAASILNPAKLPDPSDPNFNDYGNKEIQQLANFYGAEIEVGFKGEKFKSPHVIDAEQAISEWPVFRRVLQKDKESLILVKKLLHFKKYLRLSFIRCLQWNLSYYVYFGSNFDSTSCWNSYSTTIFQSNEAD